MPEGWNTFCARTLAHVRRESVGIHGQLWPTAARLVEVGSQRRL
jgi:hypothetical protein